jgi:hypothetical protein
MIAFDEARRPILAVDFPHGEVAARLDAEAEPDRQDESRLRRETLCRFLAFVSAHGSARTVGSRVLLLAFLLGQSDSKTQRALARRLRLSPGRVSQMLNVARRDFHKLAKGN